MRMILFTASNYFTKNPDESGKKKQTMQRHLLRILTSQTSHKQSLTETEETPPRDPELVMKTSHAYEELMSLQKEFGAGTYFSLAKGCFFQTR